MKQYLAGVAEQVNSALRYFNDRGVTTSSLLWALFTGIWILYLITVVVGRRRRNERVPEIFRLELGRLLGLALVFFVLYLLRMSERQLLILAGAVPMAVGLFVCANKAKIDEIGFYTWLMERSRGILGSIAAIVIIMLWILYLT